jgi:hypothetical protein
MSDDNLSQAEIDAIFANAYGSRGIKSDNIQHISDDEAAGVANKEQPQDSEEPVQPEELPNEESAQGESQSTSVDETPAETEEDILAGIEEERRAKIQEKLQALEEERKKLENERRAAVGRAAYFQKQNSSMQKALKGETAHTKAYVPPQTPEEWSALIEADSQAAKAIEAKLNAEMEARQKYLEEQIAPLRQAYEQHQQERVAWIEDQRRLVYENHPDVMDIKESVEFQQWVAGWEQVIPEFREILNRTHHAYGTQQNPGIVDIINQFKSDLQAANNPTPPPAPTAKATAVQEARNNKLTQAPPQQNKPPPVTPKTENLDAEYAKAYQAVLRKKGIPT